MPKKETFTKLLCWCFHFRRLMERRCDTNFQSYSIKVSKCICFWWMVWRCDCKANVINFRWFLHKWSIVCSGKEKTIVFLFKKIKTIKYQHTINLNTKPRYINSFSRKFSIKYMNLLLKLFSFQSLCQKVLLSKHMWSQGESKEVKDWIYSRITAKYRKKKKISFARFWHSPIFQSRKNKSSDQI